MLTLLTNFLTIMGSNVLILGIASCCGIAGFVLTIIVSIRTHNISKILKQNQIAAQYNVERLEYRNLFTGHKQSILEDGIWSDKLLKDILQDIQGYQSKFDSILTFKDRIMLFCFKHHLQKKSNDVDRNKICNYLATLSGKLEKTGDIKHG